MDQSLVTFNSLDKIEEEDEISLLHIENIEGLSNVCRTCAAVSESFVPIFDGEGLHHNLADKMLQYLSIKVSECDELSRALCVPCADALVKWHSHVQRCTRVDRLLQDRLTRLHQPPTPLAQSEQTKEEVNGQHTEDEEHSDWCAAAGACEYCGRARPSPCHLLSVHADRLFHCDECNTYVDRTDLIRHMSSHAVQYAAGPSPAPDAAPAPRSDFSDRSDTDEGFGPLPDSVFEAIEDSQDGVPPSHPHSSPLPTAMPAAVEHGNRQAKKKRTCAVCTKTFTAASSYFYHVKHVHTDGESKRHECGVCGRRFGTRAYLADHTTVHTGERRFACDRCGKLFRTRASLHIHAQTHAERRPWKCTRCPRAFACRQKLARHEVRHAAERAHACTACGRRFAMRYDLQRHERTHAAPQRHACVRCGAVYAQLRYLRVHCNKKHPADPGALPPAATHATASLPTPIPHR